MTHAHEESLNLVRSIKLAVERLDEIGAFDGPPDEHMTGLNTGLREADELAWWTLDLLVADAEDRQDVKR